MGRFLALIFIFAATCTSTHASSEECKAITDKTERLACYDKGEQPSVGEDKTAPTKEIVTAKPGDPAKRIDAADLAIAPNKYVGKNVEIVGAHCFYADVREYRCLGPGGMLLMMVSTDIAPPPEKAKLEENCGEIKKLLTNACRRTLRFAPAVIDHDKVGFADRTVVGTSFFEIVQGADPAPQRHRR